MAKINNRRVAMTKKMLKDTLIELMKEKEISQVSIRELCEKADLNRSTFYLHYLDQYDLLNSIEEEVISNTLNQFKDIKSSTISSKIIELFLSYIKENGDLFQVLLCKNESMDFKEKLIRETTVQLKRSLEFKIDGKLLPFVYAFLMDGTSGILVEWINSGFMESSGRIADLIFSLCQSVRLTSISD